MEPKTARIVAWSVAAVAAVLLFASLTGPGTGYGWHGMGWMWLWMAVPVLALLVILAELAGLNRPA